MKQDVIQTLVKSIRESAKTEVTSANIQEDGSVTMELQVDQHSLTVSIDQDGMRLVRGSVKEIAASPPNLRGRYNRIKNPEAFTADELREKNLPLYWNEDWLRKELDRLGSYTEIARTHGFPSATTIASYAKRKFGIDVQGQFEEKRKKVVEEYKKGDTTHLELAKKYDVAVATVYRWLSESGKQTKRPRRGRKPQNASSN